MSATYPAEDVLLWDYGKGDRQAECHRCGSEMKLPQGVCLADLMEWAHNHKCSE